MTTTDQGGKRGTRSCYATGCGHPACREAHRVYSARHRRLAAYGRPTTDLVDAEPVRVHVRKLQASGMGMRRIAAAAGVRRNTLVELFNGVPTRGQGPRERVKPSFADAILSVTSAPAPGARVDATGAHRRLQALIVLGWSQRQLAARLGWTPANFSTMLRTPRITLATVTAIRDLYEELWNTRPPTGTRFEKAAASRARRHAEEHQWAPPMAWDDDEIDDPAAVPDLGAPGPQLPFGQRLPNGSDLLWLMGQGLTVPGLAQRYGVNEKSVERALQRAREAAESS